MAMRAARAVLVEVDESYDDSVKVTGPFEQAIEAQLLYAGVKLTRDPSRAGFVIKVIVHGRALSASYGIAGAASTRSTLYTGATLFGSVSIESGNATVLEYPFEGRYPPPPGISFAPGMGSYRPSSAPFGAALERSMFHARVADLVAEVYGLAPLAKSLKTSDKLIRFSAALALVARADEQGLSTLLDELSQDWPGPELRKAGTDAVAKMPGVHNVEPLLQHLPDPKADLRAAIIQALARIDDPQVLSKLIGAIHANTSERISGILDALDARQGGLTMAMLIPLLEERGWEGSQMARARGAQLLGRLRNSEAVSPLESLVLNDPDEGVRVAAAEALAALDPCVAVGPLIRILSDYRSSSKVDKVVNSALSTMPGSCVTNALIKGLRSEETDRRTGSISYVPNMCAELLGLRKDPEAVESLLALVAATGTDKDLREVSICALCAIGDRRAMPILLKEVRSHLHGEQVVRALGSFRDSRALPVLLENLREPLEERIIGELIQAIADIGDLSAVEPLLAMAASGAASHDWNQQKRAFDALSALTDQRLSYDLKAWKRWWKGQRRKKSTQTLQ